MNQIKPQQKDAYTLILDAIDVGTFRPGDRLCKGLRRSRC